MFNVLKFQITVFDQCCSFFNSVELALTDYWPFIKIKSTFNRRWFYPHSWCSKEYTLRGGEPCEQTLDRLPRGPWPQLHQLLAVPVSWLVPVTLRAQCSLWRQTQPHLGTSCFLPRGGQRQGLPANFIRTKDKLKVKKKNSYTMLYLLSIQMWRKVERNHMDDPSWPTSENIRYELRLINGREAEGK